MIVVSIDPSINFCGFAIHVDGVLSGHALLTSNKSDSDYVAKSRTIYSQIKSIYEEVDKEYPEESRPKKVLVLEVPTYWKHAGFAARESGSIFKLTFLCGMICTIDDKIVTTTPDGWKGQLPKEAMNKRMRDDYKDIVDISKLNHNIVDAIGIGAWFINKHIKEKI